MENELRYENFVRGAFSTSSGVEVERAGDPANLAEAGLVSANDLSRVKSATSYAMYTYNSIITNRVNPELTEEANERLDTIVDDVLNASSVELIMGLINEYRNSYFDLLR